MSVTMASSFLFFFFFSSRRRHTRFDCDWSSDVCSSDLKAQRYRYAHGDMADLEKGLRETAGRRIRLIATDGGFSMDGDFARLDAIVELAERYGAIVMVDDSHATGFIGPTGRGTPELFGAADKGDLITSTLGKAVGGGTGGFTAGRRELIELLRQRSRPYLFSNAIP